MKDGVSFVMTPSIQKKKKVKLKRGTTRTAVFQFEEDDKQVAVTAKRGKIRLTRIKQSFIRGKFMARLNTDNWVNGTFKAEVCDWGEFDDSTEIY